MSNRLAGNFRGLTVRCYLCCLIAPVVLLGAPQSGPGAGPQFAGPAALPPGKFGVPYSYQLTVTGGVIGGYYSFQLNQGNLPAGVGLSQNGLISGTPASAGTFVFVAGYSGGAPNGSIQAIFSLTIAGNLSVATPGGSIVSQVGSEPWLSQLGYYLTIAGGAPPFTYRIASGSLPPGLQLSSDGSISGTYTTAGNYSATISITDSQGGSATFPLVEVVESTPLQIVTQSLPPLRVGLPYRIPLEVKGGTPPYQFYGRVCNMEIDEKSGIVSGSPSGCGFREDNRANLSVWDNTGLIAHANIPVAAYDYGSGVTGATMTATTQAPFLLVLPIPSGRPPFVWSATLPSGMSLDQDMGVLSGSVDQPGTLKIPVTVTDSIGTATTTIYTLNAAENNGAILTSSLPPAVAGQTYSTQLSVAAPWRIWMVSAPIANLYNYQVSQSGMLTMTVPDNVPPGEYPVTIQAANSNLWAVKVIPLSIVSPSVHLAQISLPQFIVGKQQAAGLSAFGGREPYTFTFSSPSVPPGFQMSPSGTISWTPEDPKPYQIAVTITDSSGTWDTTTLNLQAADIHAFSFFAPQMPNGLVGQPYSVSFCTRPASAPVVFSIDTGSLPPGLTLDSSTCTVSGVPGVVGVYSFSVKAFDGYMPNTGKDYQMLIGPNPAIPAVVLQAAKTGVAYSVPLPTSLTGATRWDVGPGSFPPGLSLNSSTGELNGSPSASGAFIFDVTASAANNNATTVFVLNVVSSKGVTISPATLPYLPWLFPAPGVKLAATGGVPPYVFTFASGSADGLQLTSDGILSGSITQATAVTINVADLLGNTGSITYNINPSGAPSLMSISKLPDGTVGVPYIYQVIPAAGVPPFRWTLTGADGFTIDPDGTIRGVPSAAGAINLQVSVVDSLGQQSGTNTLTITVKPTVLTVPKQSLPSARSGSAYEAGVLVTGGTPPYTCAAVSTPPAGLTLTPLCVLTGTPTAAGAPSFAVQVEDSAGAYASQTISLSISGSVPVMSAEAIVNAAGYQSGSVTPGEIIDIFGEGLGPAQMAYNSPGVNGFGTEAGQTQVLFDGTPAPMIFASDKQVAVVTPFGLANRSYTQVTVIHNGVVSLPVVLPVKNFAPGIFTADASGRGVGAILNQDGTMNSKDHPAPRGSIVTLFLTGVGALTTPLNDGQLAPLQPPFPAPFHPLFVMMGDASADIAYQGVAPGEIAGLTQLNAVVPGGVIPGLVPIAVSQFIGDYFTPWVTSQPGVWIYVQ